MLADKVFDEAKVGHIEVRSLFISTVQDCIEASQKENVLESEIGVAEQQHGGWCIYAARGSYWALTALSILGEAVQVSATNKEIKALIYPMLPVAILTLRHMGVRAITIRYARVDAGEPKSPNGQEMKTRH